MFYFLLKGNIEKKINLTKCQKIKENKDETGKNHISQIEVE